METASSIVSFTDKKTIKVALIGNPNSGKSTLFNALTGLNQKTGNFPGVTVDKRTGNTKINDEVVAHFIDLPGTYSLYPKSIDEKVAFEVVCNPDNEDYPDITIVVADASNLKRSLFLASQIIDLKVPVILALNMMDLVEKEGDVLDWVRLSERLGVRAIKISARKKEGINELKNALTEPLPVPQFNFIDVKKFCPELLSNIKKAIKVNSDFAAFQIINNFSEIKYLNRKPEIKDEVYLLLKTSSVDIKKLQSQESIERHKAINRIEEECVTHQKKVKTESFTHRLDKILTHKIYGYAIFLLVLFLIFQTIFFLAKFPQDWIEALFVKLSSWSSNTLPKGELSNLLVNGIIAGLSGVIVFIPQIALLFAFITLLEDTGYMARVSFIMDKLMRRFGLNGRSIIPLISGVACAVPAIMSARTIANWKERIITILVTPLMSCSARLPVYTLLISLMVPENKMLGFFNYQGLILMLMYLIGFVAAIGAAFVLKFVLRAKEKSYFIMELPVYRSPQWQNVAFAIYDKVRVFLFEAGKIIIAISIILWFLSTHAPGNSFEVIDKKYSSTEMKTKYNPKELVAYKASEQLEASYAGRLGKIIEPAIAPLGFDWKIGIALITSFAAREVFVGTMATIYSADNSGNNVSVEEKMRMERNHNTGLPVFSAAVCVSLLLFYAFAMQCMSTLAVVYRETKNWKMPVFQFLYMGVLAYVCSFVAYHFLK